MRNVGIKIKYKVYLKKEGYAERIINDKLQLREKGKKDEKEENVGLLDNVSRILKNNKILYFKRSSYFWARILLISWAIFSADLQISI